MILKRYLRVNHFIKITKNWLLDSKILKKTNTNTKTMLIVRVEAIGDYFHFRNFLQIIKESTKFKGYKITLCGNELYADLAETYDIKHIDDFIWINRKQFVSNSKYRSKKLRLINNSGFEYCIQPNFSREFLIGDSIVKASNAKFRIGNFGDTTNDILPFKLVSDTWYTELKKIHPNSIFEFDRNKAFFENLLNEKINITEPFLNLPKSEDLYQIILFPGAGEFIKQWPTKSFSELIKLIRNDYKEIKILICGSNGDNNLALEILQNCNFSVENFCGKTTLNELLLLINNSKLLITNDSSALHMAAVTKTNTICLLMGRHYGRFAPYPSNLAGNLNFIYPKSFFTHFKNTKDAELKTKHKSPTKIDEITVGEVYAKVKELI